MTLAALNLDCIGANVEKSLASALAARANQEADFAARAIPAQDVGSRSGPVHAASLLIWNELARRAEVPFVEANLIATIPSELLDEDLFCWNETTKPLDADRHAPLLAAMEYAKTGGFWRTDICSSSWTKIQLSETGRFETESTFSLDDPRIMDMHYGLPNIQILGRPLLTPKRIGDWPVEFRVFFGGTAAEDGAVSFYYPQAGKFEVTPDLQAAAEEARAYGAALYTKRKELGLTPWLPPAEPTDEIGATIDFMLTEEHGLVMIDAGPGFGFGAHPCCFIDTPVEGIRWALADGVEAR